MEQLSQEIESKDDTLAFRTSFKEDGIFPLLETIWVTFIRGFSLMDGSTKKNKETKTRSYIMQTTQQPNTAN